MAAEAERRVEEAATQSASMPERPHAKSPGLFADLYAILDKIDRPPSKAPEKPRRASCAGPMVA